MIRLIYKEPQSRSWIKIVWCLLIFVLVNALVWYSFLISCFVGEISRVGIGYSLPALVLLGLDIGFYINQSRNWRDWRVGVDVIIWIALVLSFSLPSFSSNYLSLLIVIRLYDVIYLKDLLFDLFKLNPTLLKAYIVIKIIYWMLIIGHISACFFYLLDILLIQNQTFGPFQQNPATYYQGELLAYTPILMFDTLVRYLYAIYFTYALLSTIAFGDIIGKNYIQDIYVMILIIVATIGIALIIEQMYIVFRREKTRFLILVNQVRFFSEKLKSHQTISRSFRHQLINYIIDVKWRESREEPVRLMESPELAIKLLRESIVCQKQLIPQVFSLLMLDKFKEKHCPMGMVLLNNSPENVQSEMNACLVIKAQLKIGYTSKNVGSITKQAEGTIFGCDELLMGTNYRYRHLRIESSTNAILLILTHQQFRAYMLEISDGRDTVHPKEYYQQAKDEALFSTTKYPCFYCHSDQHDLVNCQKSHLVLSEEECISIWKQQNSRSLRRRTNLPSKKIIGAQLEILDWKDQREHLDLISSLKESLRKTAQGRREKTQEGQVYYSWLIYQQAGTLSHANQKIINSANHHL